MKKEELSKWQCCYHSQDRTNRLKMEVIMISTQMIQVAQHFNFIKRTNHAKKESVYIVAQSKERLVKPNTEAGQWSESLTTTTMKGAKEKLLPNFEEISTENRFFSTKQQISTRIPLDHCTISCNLKPKVHKPCINLSITN